MIPEDRPGLDDPERRTYLLQLLTCGVLGAFPYRATNAFWFSGSPKKIAEDKSIFTLKGKAWVNGRPADLDTRIRGGDRVRTGDKSEIIFAVGGDSFLLRSQSEMEISGADYFIDSLRIVTGRLLSVFARRAPNRQLGLSASTATIGIRGSAVYVETEPELTYLCTCYGQVALSASDDPDDSEIITTTNHDEPRYISSNPSRGTRIRKAPVINHTNRELELLETIVGRQLPRALREGYGA